MSVDDCYHFDEIKKSQDSTKKMKQNSHKINFWILILMIVICIEIIVPVILGTFVGGYSHLTDTISSLGIARSPVKQYHVLSLIISGVFISFFGYGQYKLFFIKSKYEILYAAGLIVFGIGNIVAGIFPEDTKEIIPESISSKIHGISSFIGFVFVILCPYWATRIEQIKTKKILNYVFFILAIITFIFFIISGISEEGILKYTGLFQRINLSLIYTILFLNSWNLRLEKNKQGSQENV